MHRQNEKIWNKTSHPPIFDGFKVREWLYEACWYFSWYWRVFIACKLWELNRGVQKAFWEQNHLRLHTRLTSEKQLFVCLFSHLFSTFHIEIWWRAAWTRRKQMCLPNREEFDMQRHVYLKQLITLFLLYFAKEKHNFLPYFTILDLFTYFTTYPRPSACPRFPCPRFSCLRFPSLRVSVCVSVYACQFRRFPNNFVNIIIP